MKNSRKKEAACVKCGTCNTVCPVYQVSGNEVHTPRGKQHLRSKIEKGEVSTHYADIFSKCLLCGACLEACPRGLDTPALIIAARSELPKLSGLSFLKYVSRKALIHPSVLTGLARIGAAAKMLLEDVLPEDSGLRLRLQGLDLQALKPPPAGFIEKLKSQSSGSQEGQEQNINFFTGCFANHLQPEIAESTQFLVTKTTGSRARVPFEQTCCGMAALAAGRIEEARQLAQKNIIAFESNENPILTSCSSCYYQLKSYEELFADDPEWLQRAEHFSGRLQEFSTFFLDKVADCISAPEAAEISAGKKVFYHDPCHLRFKIQITREPRQLIKSIPGIDLQELPDGPQCCGQGGLFQVAHPAMAMKIRDSLMDEFSSLDAQTVLTACTGCLLQWQLGLRDKDKESKAEHLAIFIARHLQ